MEKEEEFRDTAPGGEPGAGAAGAAGAPEAGEGFSDAGREEKRRFRLSFGLVVVLLGMAWAVFELVRSVLFFF